PVVEEYMRVGALRLWSQCVKGGKFGGRLSVEGGIEGPLGG
ncbi:hypothetical protein A2U01_0074023, partial [Trifolium medium]|nr:hypothetical protein [Trifolium medium]